MHFSEVHAHEMHALSRRKASFLRYIYIPFPGLDDCHFGSVTLQEDSIHMLEMIRDYFTNIATLETLLYTSAEMESRLDAADSPRAADEALTLVDVRFKAIPSLKEVIVNLYDKTPSDYLRKKIQKCGWTIKVTALEESDGVGFSDEDDGDYSKPSIIR
jgi:hypothetical protein